MSTNLRHHRTPLTFLLSLLLVISLLPASAGATPGPGATSDDRIPGQILVKFKDSAPGYAAVQARRQAAAEELSTIVQLGVHVWRVPEHASARVLQALQRNPNVEFAELDAVVETDGEVVPNDPWFRHQWGPTKVNGPTAWATTTGTKATKIAIVDTGVTEIGDLGGKVLRGYNALDGSTNSTDNHGHGTRSASVAGAATNNGDGIAAYCWECMILPVKVMETGSGTMSDLARGITWAADNGAHVISMSLSGTTGTSAVANAVKYAENKGAVLVAAAGNQGDTTPRYPAAYAEVIAVAATDGSDSLYSWSNYGQWVDVSAPGINYSVGRDGSIGTYAGTSSATPAVAGVLGLGISEAVSAIEVRDALQAGAKSLSTVKYGRIDAAAMLDLLGPSATITPDPEPEPTEEPTPEPAPAEDPAPDPEPHPPASEPEPSIALSVTTSKTRGLGTADLRWSGATSTRLDIRVDGSVHATVKDSGRFVHETGQRGNPTVTYQVCEAGSKVCSVQVTVSNW